MIEMKEDENGNFIAVVIDKDNVIEWRDSNGDYQTKSDLTKGNILYSYGVHVSAFPAAAEPWLYKKPSKVERSRWRKVLRQVDALLASLINSQQRSRI